MAQVIAGGQYGITAKELSTLVSDSSEKPSCLADAGGTTVLAEKIRTDINAGLSGDKEDIDARREFYGKNFVEGKPPKTFCELCWAAMQDFTLIMLVICAVISLVLGISIAVTYSIDTLIHVC